MGSDQNRRNALKNNVNPRIRVVEKTLVSGIATAVLISSTPPDRGDSRGGTPKVALLSNLFRRGLHASEGASRMVWAFGLSTRELPNGNARTG
jgi:hypothetical protein